MARSTNNTGSSQAEISVFAFSIKGDVSVVQTALQTLAKQGVSFQPPPPPFTPKPPAVALPAGNANGSAAAPVQPGLFDSAAVPAAEAEVEASSSTPTPSLSKSSRPRTFSPVEPLESLNVNDAPMPFHEFVKGRTIDGANERGLVAATWVRDHRQTKQFGTRHIATAFKALHWPMPEDPGSLLRNLKKGGFVKSAGPGVFELTTRGDEKYGKVK
jgi:hypothetical protein